MYITIDNSKKATLKIKETIIDLGTFTNPVQVFLTVNVNGYLEFKLKIKATHDTELYIEQENTGDIYLRYRLSSWNFSYPYRFQVLIDKDFMKTFMYELLDLGCEINHNNDEIYSKVLKTPSGTYVLKILQTNGGALGDTVVKLETPIGNNKKILKGGYLLDTILTGKKNFIGEFYTKNLEYDL